MEAYLQRLSVFLREAVPDLASEPQAQFIEQLRFLARQAQSYGLTSEQGIAIFAITAAQLGLDFVEAFPGAKQILEDPMDESEKAEMLEAFTLNLLEILES